MNKPGRPDTELVEVVRRLVDAGQPEALIREVSLATARDLAHERVNPTGLGPKALSIYAGVAAQGTAYLGGVPLDSSTLHDYRRLGAIVASLK